MYCCNCGKELEEEARYCSVCGTARPAVRPSSGESRETRRLRRVREGKWIGGVCTGVARYFNVDTPLIRIVWILVTIFPPFLPGIIGYIVCWAAMPEDPRPVPDAPRPASASSQPLDA